MLRLSEQRTLIAQHSTIFLKESSGLFLHLGQPIRGSIRTIAGSAKSLIIKRQMGFTFLDISPFLRERAHRKIYRLLSCLMAVQNLATIWNLTGGPPLTPRAALLSISQTFAALPDMETVSAEPAGGNGGAKCKTISLTAFANSLPMALPMRTVFASSGPAMVDMLHLQARR